MDQDNNQVKLEGVEFEVLDENDNVLEKITTDKNGEALTSRYPIRDFEKIKIRESKTLETYVLSNEVKTVTLKENEIKTVIFQNEKKKAQIRVIKVDQDNNEILLEGVTFDVINNAGEIVDTIVTGSDGIATTKRIPIDSEYTIIERKTKKEYKLTKETQTVTLEQDEIKNIIFQNEKRKGQLRIIKVDLDDNEILLEGVIFDILDKYGNVVDTVVTNEKGEATSKRLPCIDEEYTAIERETRKEYVLTEKPQTITLTEDEITSIQFENEKIKGYLEITKVDSKTKDTLKDAVFGIYDMDNNEIAIITTDETGKATSELIPYGKYYAKELDTGSVYYLLNENTFEFEITKNHETVPITIENDSVDIEVTVDKEGSIEIKPGEKVNYEFSNVGNASNVYLENFKWYDYIPTDYIRLETMTTGTWNQDLTYNVYYKTNNSDDYVLFRENLSTKENYNLDFTSLEFSENEYITETCFDFGKVDIGFREDIKPTMECKSFDTLKDNDTFTNHTKTVGVYFGVTAEANSKWTTITHTPEEKHEDKLPRTGK
ncbi:MAG: SpaA isopeptide-forming pilin-related protein [Clostridia bacterium]|nr:SpaA isopeptide-forming pilin-related protein [Clostridia bacterium]